MIPEWQRVRLRPDVDVPALEHILEEFPADVRPAVLRHFEPDILPALATHKHYFEAECPIPRPGQEAEERMRTATHGGDYLYRPLEDERRRALYERVFVRRRQVATQDLLVTRIPTCVGRECTSMCPGR
jgi:hypothetical protein